MATELHGNRIQFDAEEACLQCTHAMDRCSRAILMLLNFELMPKGAVFSFLVLCFAGLHSDRMP